MKNRRAAALRFRLFIYVENIVKSAYNVLVPPTPSVIALAYAEIVGNAKLIKEIVESYAAVKKIVALATPAEHFGELATFFVQFAC